MTTNLQKLDYQRQLEQVIQAKNTNKGLSENTRITKQTLIVSIIVGIFSAISAIAEILQLYAK